MKFNESWLREWVNPAVSTEQLCDQITMLGLEVDDAAPVAGAFSGVVVGEVVECAQHSDADKLRVTKVNVGGDRLLDIVCGAPNCRQGLKVACATEGAVLPGDFKIKKTKLRGQPSEGMLCSYSELGIKEDHSGIIELPADAPIGKDFREYLDLNDVAIEISLTPNRADCLSIAGIAREVGVINRAEVKAPVISEVPATIADKVAVELQAPEACPRYLARVVKNVNVKATSPLWLQEKLRRCGIRSIDPIVDITNLSLLELGQPMHAFDASKIDGAIQVRMAKEGEELVLLDGTTAKLQPNTLVIADSKGALAMAGIFGGEASGVNENTTDVVLESAFFAPLAITGRARQYGLHTDASHRFERGVDPQLARDAMERATALLLEICGGEAGEIVEAVSEQHLPKRNTVTLRRSKLDAVIGHHIEDETVTDILTRLGLNVIFANDSWTAVAPSWRFDIEIEEDLIEEVARIYGYNSIPNNSPLAHLTMKGTPEKLLEVNRIRTALVDSDYQEVVTYSFVDPKKQALLHPNQEALILPNPISSEMSAMRLSLLTGLLDTIAYNQSRQQTRVRIFEGGLRFIPDAAAESGIRQELVFGAAIVGDKRPVHWESKGEAVDFFDLKGDMERVLSLTSARHDLKFVAKQFPALHPGQSAAIMLDGKEIGFIGSVHPSIVQKLGIKGKPVVFEILGDAIANRPVPAAKEISKFPANNRDIAVVVDENVPAGDVLDACRHAGGVKLVAVNLFDVYRGANLAAGKKSLAISLTVQDTEKTLEEEEISTVIQAVLAELAQRFQAYLRD
ncbi:putative phenylalanyl-tRNA synthetase subunit beta [Actinobacillus pleuropneumoniae]|uniref:Phenylalanine--tRNA ligase beta subunit n=1 Tax=Actinobacillus pleuropneumoniae serotype 3 (strain JL03) TaxID=434271 RepID=B0BNN8_ACTPJ|nr:phenylalanine--tRNA ligase subunit beta [Actinobacillus pleuropneumoniae]ABY69173.1 phenylalanyl-tRNA synthetase, beta subunit [Actinobacillus pleuropneumoniae serovar 3 str. JL03]KIE92332.1 putative phenylalanyl-tRNA synthetase subunit beta [Actinobacillus pleuropneumoniae]KIE92470.1 putative phenylalanyl-tRNA synthetase subunit beta [Actinobacillus pleuropneumoniae]KIE92596.1 putative phenylalanyl-tRNA synthetase subunit beta [Actinobacillus pleuropneumoniae]KIE97558.1 putative phenylalan